MEGDIALGMKYIGAGLACFGIGSFLDGALRNPSAASQQTGNLFVGAALAEALGLFAFVVAMLLLFAA
jgi:F-type H+-transporting ATPase subunit c